jgi:hypothetical protein
MDKDQAHSPSAGNRLFSSTKDVAPSGTSATDQSERSTDASKAHTVTLIADNVHLSDEQCGDLVRDLGDRILGGDEEAVIHAWIN